MGSLPPVHLPALVGHLSPTLRQLPRAILLRARLLPRVLTAAVAHAAPFFAAGFEA